MDMGVWCFKYMVDALSYMVGRNSAFKYMVDSWNMFFGALSLW